MRSIAKFLVLVAILVSCHEDEQEKEGKIQFSFNVKGSAGLIDAEPNSINVTIKNIQGEVVLQQKVTLTNDGGGYLSDEVTLKAGSYSITKFDVLDANGETIYSAPMEGSTGANLVNDPLNVETTVSPGITTELTIDVLEVKGKIQFSFNVKGSALIDEEPNSINVTIKNIQGEVVLQQKVTLTNDGGGFLSDEVTLKAGSYSITTFDVLDANGETIYSAPMEGSTGANLVNDPLNVETTVSPGITTELTIDVLEVKGKIQFSFNVKGSTRLVDSEPKSTKITLKNGQGGVALQQTLPLTKLGDKYYSVVSMTEGSYSITAFDVLNATDEAIYTVPQEGSDRAYLVADPLNIATIVSAGVKTEMTIEVVAVKYNKALSFDGTDDYVNLGNIYDDIQLPISISAWIWVDPYKTSQIPIFASQDNPAISLYKGFHFVINPTHLFTGYGDGLGSNNPYYRRELSGSQTGQFGKWIYVSAVLRGAEDMEVYLDGVSLAKTYTGTSPNPMISSFPDAVAKIGIWTTNGVTYHFKGMIDELKVWNRALTSTEVNNEMTNRPTGNEAGLVGYWNFDEDDGDQVLDGSGENHNGVLQAGTARVPAPISGF